MHAERTASREDAERPSEIASSAVSKQVVTQVNPGFVRAAIGPATSPNSRDASTKDHGNAVVATAAMQHATSA